MNYYIGIDLGTSSVKVMLTKGNGEIVASESREYEVYYPQSGWSEQNPGDWWNAVISAVCELIKDFDADKIKGIGVAGQMHGLVVLDKDDNVIRPAILWNDGRTQKETDYLNNVIGKQNLSDMTANIAFAGFTAPKLLWLKENEPENFEKIEKIMLPKDYINYKLTKIHATDYSDASGTLLLDVKNKCWSEKMLDICGISEKIMPRLYNSYEVIGNISKEASEELKIGSDAKVVAGAGDNAGAAIGTGTVGNGKCNISLGTSGTIFVSSSKFSVDNNNALHSFCHSDGGYHLMGCILSAASCNKWICNEIFNTNDYKSEESRIGSDMLGNNNVFFLPYLMGERSPINDTYASGLFIGLRPDTKRENLYLSVLEGVAFAIRDNLEIVKKLGISIKSSFLCGGGAKSVLWRKILANVLNIELHLPISEEGPGYGAAMLAMVGAGEYKNIDDCCKKLVKTKEIIRPDEKLSALYDKKYCDYKKIYPSVKQLYKELKS